MTQDYFNPNAMTPQNGWKPQGFLGGMQYAQQDMNYQDVVDLQRQLTLENIAKQGMENQHYRDVDLASGPAEGRSKTSKFNLDTIQNDQRANSPEFLGASLAGDIGDAQGRAAAGQFAQQTNQGKIDVANAHSKIQQWDAAADQLQRTPTLTVQANWQQVRASLPPQVQNMFPQQYDPSVPQRIKQFTSAANSALSNHVREMAKVAAETQSREKIGAGNNAATIEAARLRWEAQRRDTFNSFTRAMASGNALGIMTAGQLILDTEDQLKPEVRAAITTAITHARAALSAQRAPGQLGPNDLRNPGSTQNRIDQSLGGGLQVPGGTFPGPGPQAADPLGLRR